MAATRLAVSIKKANMSHQPSAFYLALENVINNWSALQLAIQYGMGGHDSLAKKDWLVGALEQYFIENNGLEVDEVEDFLTDVLNDEFNSVADDGSVQELAKKFCNFYQLYRDNQTEKLLQLLPLLPKLQQRDTQQARESLNDSSKRELLTNQVEPTEAKASSEEWPLAESSLNDEDMEVDVDANNSEEWQTINRSRRKFPK